MEASELSGLGSVLTAAGGTQNSNTSNVILPTSLDLHFQQIASSAFGSDDFNQRIYTFDDPSAQYDGFLDSAGTSIYEAFGPDLTQGSGGTGANKAFIRIKGNALGVHAPVNLATMFPGGGFGSVITSPGNTRNPQNTPWAIGGKVAAGNVNNNQLVCLCYLSASATDPANNGVGFVYVNQLLKLWTNSGGVNNVQSTGINFGTTVGSGNGSLPFVGLTFDGVQIRSYVNGAQVGNPFSAIQGVPATECFLTFGVDEKGVGANSLNIWETLIIAFP